MLIEAVTQPIKYQWPEGEILFEPGKPIQVPDDRGQKVLAKCGSKVRKVSPDWMGAWDELAQLTDGVQKTDNRFGPVMAALDRCDRAFESGDWPAFLKAAEQVKRIVQEVKKENSQ